MQRSTSALTLLSAASLTCGLVLTPAVPALAHEEHGTASASDTTGDQRTRRIDGENTVAGVHANLVDLSLRDGALTLGSRASTHDGEGIYDPARTVFHLPNTDSTRSTVAAGYEFIAPKGTPIWYIPHTGTGGVLHPGFGADSIPRDALKENKISLELVRTQAPDGGSVEVFREDPSGPTRLFSSRENLPAHTITAGEHAHPGWAFTAPGVYRLTFRATAQRADGTPISAEQTYTVAVGDVPANIFEQMRALEGERHGGAPKAADHSAAASAASTAGAGAPKTPANISGANTHTVRQAGAPASGGSNGASQQPRAEHPAAQGPAPEPQAQQAGNSASQGSGVADRSTPEAVNAAEPSGGNGAANTADSGGTGTGGTVQSITPPAGASGGKSVRGSNSANVAPGASHQGAAAGSGSAGGGAGSSGAGSGGSDSAGSGSEKCYATEVQVKDAKQSLRSPASVPSVEPALHTATVQNVAEYGGADRATEGHFDVGPVLNGSTLSSAVKDDRFSPPKHVSPSSLNFVLGDAAKLKFPAGMEDIAPAGSTVHMIGATQQAGVPWLGWSTQDPELLKQADGPVTMSLKGFDGPGSMSVFLSGNFGSAGQKVFTSRGGSFQVPLNTHQHSNWVFTAEGRYRVTIGWQVRLKNGQTVESTSTLNFTVGNGSGENTSGGDKQQGAQKPADNGGHRGGAHNDTPAGESKTPDKQAGRGTVDAASGIVTKPDGTKVRIVGKTASGKDCALTNQELKDAQQAAAAGQLASTGAGFNPFMVSTSVLAVALGGMIVYAVRRRKRHAA